MQADGVTLMPPGGDALSEGSVVRAAKHGDMDYAAVTGAFSKWFWLVVLIQILDLSDAIGKPEPFLWCSVSG